MNVTGTEIPIVFEDGKAERQATAVVGDTLMETAVAHGIEAVEAVCGGCCACATCQVHFDDDWFTVVGPPSEMEKLTLCFGKAPWPNSRLSCQIIIEARHRNLRVRVEKLGKKRN